MHQRAVKEAQGLRARGVITDEEFQNLKAKVMAGAS
jgi:hypothetical protein